MHGLRVVTLLDMDAMMATLEFVANSDFMTILPETICANDIDGAVRSLHPIVDPTLSVDYAIIEPAKSALPPAAALFLEGLERQYHVLKSVWQDVRAPAN